jgi:Flp pilus assembly protein TadB
MAIPFLSRKKEDELQEKKRIVNKIKKEEQVESSKQEKNLFQIPGFQQYSALTKLRIGVSMIFILCTAAMILIFANGYMISAVLLLIGYVMLFLLLLKLFRVKKL